MLRLPRRSGFRNVLTAFALAAPSLVFAAPDRAAVANAAGPLGNAERRAVIVALAAALERDYVFPEVGARYAAFLRDRLARGLYDGVIEPAALGAALTADLRSVSPDAHLRVGPREGFRRPRTMPADMPASARPSGPPGLEDARMLDGTVAYLRFNEFPDDLASATRARAFLLAHANARAIIVDCRPNRGGGMSVMNALLPLFYDKPVVQVRMDTRTAAEADAPSDPDPVLVHRTSPADLVRYDHGVVPDPAETRLRRTPVYYLTSRRTASAAEHMALALKRNHRAVLVGETTAGANHFGEEVPLGKSFLAFIPIGRSYDPDTGRDWEGSGIAPDVPTTADKALAMALRLSRGSAPKSLATPFSSRAVRPRPVHPQMPVLHRIGSRNGGAWPSYESSEDP